MIFESDPKTLRVLDALTNAERAFILQLYTETTLTVHARLENRR
jgi:hypothetical protein